MAAVEEVTPRARLLEELEARKAWVDSRIADARKKGTRVDLERFALHLGRAVAPCVDAVARALPDRVSAVIEGLVDVSLELAAQDWMGPQSALVEETWARALSAAPTVLATSPATVARRATAGVTNVALVDGARPREWIALMAAIAPHCTTPGEWFTCGGVAAWTAGVAHARRTAFALAGTIRAPLARAALGLDAGESGPPIEPLLAALEADPWLQPARASIPPQRRRLRLVRAVGGFRGFGGPFLTPPDVWRIDGHFYLVDNETAWELHADARGTTFVRVSRELVGKGNADLDIAPFALDAEGRVSHGRQSRAFAECEAFSSAAADSTTLVVAGARSHRVFVIAFAEEA